MLFVILCRLLISKLNYIYYIKYIYRFAQYAEVVLNELEIKLQIFFNSLKATLSPKHYIEL